MTLISNFSKGWLGCRDSRDSYQSARAKGPSYEAEDAGCRRESTEAKKGTKISIAKAKGRKDCVRDHGKRHKKRMSKAKIGRVTGGLSGQSPEPFECQLISLSTGSECRPNDPGNDPGKSKDYPSDYCKVLAAILSQHQ